MEIQLYSQIVNPLEAMDKFGVALAKSGMFGCDNENAGKVLAMICMTERKSPTELLRTYDIIGGKLRKKAMAAFAEFRGKGGKVKWLATGEDGKEARAEFTFEGQSITLAFTMEQAKKAGLVKACGGWEKSPANMLRARVISNALGMLCPEIFAGGAEDEEAPVAPAPEIKLSTPPPATVEVEAVAAVVAPEVPLAVPVRESATTPPPSTPKPAPVVDVAASVAPEAQAFTPPSGERLSDEMVQKLEQAIGEDGPQAAAWFLKQGWLKPGKGMDCLTATQAGRILRQTASFKRAINGGAQ